MAWLSLAACATTSHGIPRSVEPLHPAEAPVKQPPSPVQLMIDTAASMIGQPYRFGGAAPGGFDCSGLVVYAMGGAGFQLPRTAREQMHVGAPIARRALQPGDLVFMHLAHKDLHVGIAIDNERFVHAPATGGYVRIDSLAAPPYAHAYLTARRIVDD